MGPGETHNPTEPLVRAAALGDHQAFEELMQRYAPLIAARTRRFAKSPEHAEDLIQEVMVKAYCQLQGLRQPGRFGPWLSTLALNVARDEARRPRLLSRQLDGADQIAGGPSGPLHRLEQSETEAAVLSAIDRLGRRNRDVVYLSLIEELSSPEIAKLLDLKESAVRMRLSKGMKKVRSHLSKMGYGPSDGASPGTAQRKN